MSRNAASEYTSQSRVWQLLRRIAAIGGGIIVLVAVLAGCTASQTTNAPAAPDLSTTQTSAQGLYQATIRPDTDPIPVNELHSWVLHLENPDGQPIENAAITVAGDMPEHDHGLPTQPEVTQELGGGDYLVEGMKFQMGGRWVIDFDISADGRSDQVSFNLMLQ